MVISPGGAAGVFKGKLVVIFGTGVNSGLFVYSGTPAAGNPPVFWVVAPGVSSDPYGNAVTPIMGAGTSGGQFTSIDSGGDIILHDGSGNVMMVLNPGRQVIELYNPPPAAAGNLVNTMATGQTGFDVFGNPIASGFACYSGNNALDTFMTLVQSGLHWGTNSNLPGGTGSLTSGGPITLRIQDLFVATDPATGNTNEAWHTISLAAGWSTVAGQPVPSYRLLPDGNVQITGVATHAAFAVNTTLNSVNLAAAYQPATLQIVSGELSGEANISISTAGAITARPPASTTTCRFNGTYPVNL
jgi:hypothetical protein